tara:strand:- start:1011 stop:2036 length:1026 start_codon:yes stop_codon:yes gene_type:complete
MLKPNFQTFLSLLYKRVYERAESIKINASIKNNLTETFNIVYDYKVSPPTFGDLMAVIMLSRFLMSTGAKIKFIFIDDGFRVDWFVLSEQNRAARLAEHLSLVNVLLGKEAEIVKIGFSDLLELISANKIRKSEVILFRRVIKRKPLYRSSWNLLNLLYNSSNKNDKSFLLSAQDLEENISLFDPPQKFVSWHCRKSNKESSQERNTRETEFYRVCHEMIKLFPDRNLLIISDENGCEHYKKLAQKKGLNLFFSKDYSESFLGDGFLILKSHFHFISRGGGIDMFSLFSENSYQAYVDCVSEKPWSNTKAHPWSNDNQAFYDINSLDVTYLPSSNLKYKKL